MREKNLGFDDHRLLMETFELLDRNLGIRKTISWPTKEDGEAFKEAFESFRADVVRPALKTWREFRHSLILDFLKPAVTFYAERRKTQSLVNFEDLLMLTAKLLRKNPEVRRYFGRRYTHLLVDEFQDTDPIQAEVLLYLTGTDCEESDWRKIVPRPGSLIPGGGSQAIDLQVPEGGYRHLQPGQGPDREGRRRGAAFDRQLPVDGCAAGLDRSLVQDGVSGEVQPLSGGFCSAAHAAAGGG